MANTFQIGVSPDVFEAGRNQCETSLRTLFDEVSKNLPAGTVGSRETLVRSVLDTYTKEWFNAAWEAHAKPLLPVVGPLPIDEMANLAETLVELESLKEKVTKPTESVGGPIDVAVISKSDGFIWIKRKHYFEGTLNPRFFHRHSEGS